MEMAADSSGSPSAIHFSLFLYKIFIDVVLTQQPGYQQYKPLPQSWALFSVCLPALFVCFPLQICRCQGEVFVPISRDSRDRDEAKAATRTLQLAQIPTESKLRDIHLSSQTGSVLVLCQTGADTQLSQQLFFKSQKYGPVL